MPEPNNDESNSAEKPEIVLRRFDDDDAEMIEQILDDGGVKPEVIRRA